MSLHRRPLPVLLLGIALLTTGLLNGAGFFLKRIGIWETEHHQSFSATRSTWAIGACDFVTVEHPAKPNFDYLFQHPGGEVVFKLFKELLFASLILFLAFQLFRSPDLLPSFARAGPLYILALLVVISALTSWMRFGSVMLIVAGLRSFLFLPVALASRPVTGPEAMGFYARCVLLLALLQLPLQIIEAARGLPIAHLICLHGVELAARTAGSFVHPNTLGIFMAAALFFFIAHGPRPGPIPMVLLFALFILSLLSSGSATGLIVLLTGGILWLLQFQPAHLKKWFYLTLIITLPLLVLMLPTLLERPDLFYSLDGRMRSLMRVIELAETPLELLIGQGLGMCTNAAITFFGGEWQPESRFLFETDSSLSLLLAQTGILGVAAYFTLLGLLFVRDARQRPFYLAVALSSLTTNLIEVFPLNLMLALSIASSLSRSGYGRS